MPAKTSLTIASLLMALPVAAHAETPAAYVAKAGASDLYEKTSSSLVLRSTKDAKVRSFATMMVRDHNKSTAMVKAAAAKARLEAAAPRLTPDQRAMIAALNKATGAARDSLYWEQQKAAHAEALTLHQSYASTGAAEPLKTAAARIVPVVKQHIDILNGGEHQHH